MKRIAIGTLILLMWGCQDDTEGSEKQSEPTVTFSEHVRPIIESNCLKCHHTGGPGPFPMETYEEVRNASSAMLNAMIGGRMPPWPADPDCRSYVDERLLPTEHLNTFQTWVDEGRAEGETTEPLVFESTTFEANLTVTSKTPYTPDLSSAGDDYRCFILDADFDTTQWVYGSTIKPDTKAVHHVLVFALNPEQIAVAEDLDAEDTVEGYTCFGGPLPQNSNTAGTGIVSQVAGWAPGAVPRSGTQIASPIAAGSKLVMQVHYSAVGGEPEPDATELLLNISATPPAEVARTVPLAILDIDIPAGEASVNHTRVFRNWSDTPTTIRAFTGHMHLLGTEVKATVVKADGGEECGLSIPDWDFDWQLSYALHDDDAAIVAPGDGVEVSCTYNNSESNQPFVDGQQIEPRDVAWGDGSLDEMCLVYATEITPYEEPPEAASSLPCAAAAECYAASDGSMSALMACEAATPACALCPIQAIQASQGCGLLPCVFSLADARACITDCVIAVNAFGGSIDQCLRGSCSEAWESYLTCADPIMQSGDCDADLGTACGITP